MRVKYIHRTATVDEGSDIGQGTSIWHYCHVCPGAVIGEDCIIGQGVFIDSCAVIGNNCKIQNGVSVYSGVTLEDGVFVGPHVTFTNDKWPIAVNGDGSLKSKTDWKLSHTMVRRRASIGANSTILCGIEIGLGGYVIRLVTE